MAILDKCISCCTNIVQFLPYIQQKNDVGNIRRVRESKNMVQFTSGYRDNIKYCITGHFY